MNRVAFNTLVVALALLLALTGQTAAVARGHVSAVGELVICSDGGTLVILVDAEGNRVPTRHVCADCVLAFGPALLDAPELAASAHLPAIWASTVGRTEALVSELLPWQARARPVRT